MVHPIASSLPAAQFGHVSAEFDRPTSPPEPAVQVTAGSEAQGSGTATTSKQQYGQEPGTENPSLEKALESLNNSMRAWATGMRFDMDDEAQRLVVSIIDSETGDVIRTVPSDAVIRVAKMIVQLQGSMVNTKA
jgi:flagellar protein FlaG